MKYRHIWIILLAIFAIGCAENQLRTLLTDGSDPVITAPPDAVWQATEMIRQEQGIDLTAQKVFYTKYIDAAGIAILANDGVADQHLIEARQMIIALTAKRPELRDMLSTQRDNVFGAHTDQGFYMILHSTNYWKVPELADLPPFGSGSCYLRGSRRSGIVGYCHAVLRPPHWRNDSASGDTVYLRKIHPLNTFTHEFGHALHDAIFRLDPTALDRLKQSYQHQLTHPDSWTHGHTYARLSFLEYWAVAIELWYYEPAMAIDISKSDPTLITLIEEWLPSIPERE